MGGYNITGHRHWAAEVAKVRGGAAKDPTGDHCSDTILYPLRDRQPIMQCITHVGSDGTKLVLPPPNKANAELGPARPMYQGGAQPAKNSSQYGWLQTTTNLYYSP